MDQTLANLFEELKFQSKKVLQVENKNWASYIRSEFAELRSIVHKIEIRQTYLNKAVQEIVQRIDRSDA